MTNSELKEIHRIIKSGKGSTYRTKDNKTHVTDSTRFRSFPVNKMDMINDIMENASKREIQEKGIQLTTLDSLERQAKSATQKALFTIVQDKKGANYVRDNVYNSMTNTGTAADPSMYGNVFPNLWISPYEASALYSQKGLPELIINKKSKSIFLNGIKIKNAKLKSGQLDSVNLNMVKLGIPKVISDAVRDSLVYGGDLVFPLFKKDTPITTLLPFNTLIKTGILAKNSIDYIVSLDRWNTMHLPFTNPTHRDYLNPEKYFIPYLGADLHGSRASRIVTGSQAGWLGQVATYGWGLSDFCGYMREIINYKNAVNTLPVMIQQMSILARTIPVDGILASEGANALDALTEQNTIKIRQMSLTNPINIDLLGELHAINRDFAEVPSLIRLLRQDAAAAASVPEPLLWSSEKGNFSSGDDTEGNLHKQYESIKYIHSDVQMQFKKMAMILVIDALGTDKDVIDALPYTEMHFDVPMVANAAERARVGYDISQTYFQLVASQMPASMAAQIASSYAGDELSFSSELLDDLERRQKESDERAKEKHEKEMELMEAQIEDTKESCKQEEKKSLFPSLRKKEPEEKKKYDKLEQRQHEKTRIGSEKRGQALQRRSSETAASRSNRGKNTNE